MGRKSKSAGGGEWNLSGLVKTPAPDNPGETVPTTIRLRTDQKEWLDSYPESNSYLIRKAIDFLMEKSADWPSWQENKK